MKAADTTMLTNKSFENEFKRKTRRLEIPILDMEKFFKWLLFNV
jgi:hypothetical protein